MARKTVEAQFPNTRMEATYNEDKTVRRFYIFPAEGYKLHDNAYDEPVCDENGIDTGETVQGFTTAFTTVVGEYDFEKNPDNIFAVPLNKTE